MSFGDVNYRMATLTMKVAGFLRCLSCMCSHFAPRQFRGLNWTEMLPNVVGGAATLRATSCIYRQIGESRRFCV